MKWSSKALQTDQIIHVVLVEFRFFDITAIAVVIIGIVGNPVQFCLRDWCIKYSRSWFLDLYIFVVSVSQRSISFLISDAKLGRFSSHSKKFHVFRSSLLRHRDHIVTLGRNLDTAVAWRWKNYKNWRLRPEFRWFRLWLLERQFQCLLQRKAVGLT